MGVSRKGASWHATQALACQNALQTAKELQVLQRPVKHPGKVDCAEIVRWWYWRSPIEPTFGRLDTHAIDERGVVHALMNLIV